MIVVVHWNPIDVEWFPQARVADGRHREALVPLEWQIDAGGAGMRTLRSVDDAEVACLSPIDDEVK